MVYEEKDFVFDSVSPELTAVAYDGRKISLSQFRGNVIILRFSKFYFKELASILYLEHLAKSLEDEGVSLIFVNTLGEYDARAINKYIDITYPVIEDDGSISSLFSANHSDTFIIGKDFRIKFKLSEVDNGTIYKQVIRYADGDSAKSVSIPNHTLSGLIKKIFFRDIRDSSLENFGNFIEGKKAVLNLFISPCFGCPEGRRISLLRELSQKIDLNQ